MPSTIDEPHNEIVQRARKWVAECKLACWCLEQNLKGISVPASLAIDHYLSLWGQAPHTERVSKHLNQFVEPSKWKNGCSTLKNIGFYKCLMLSRPSADPRTNHSEGSADDRPKTRKSPRTISYSLDNVGSVPCFSFGPSQWAQTWVPALVPVLFCIGLKRRGPNQRTKTGSHIRNIG